jgi:cyclopropane-fatty-acyl-phospholipid synthase
MRFLLEFFGRMQRGCLTVRLPDGTQHVFGDSGSSHQASLTVNHYRFFSRTVFGGEVGFGESYTAGDWDSDDLTAVIRFLLENRETVKSGSFTAAAFLRARERLVRLFRPNTRAGSRKHIHAHYDLSNEFFQSFLDKTMTYSCGLYLAPEDDLETAQINKLNSIIRKAKICSDDHVLEIGCGWGGFALEAVKTTGCKVTGITVSPSQHQLATERVRQAGLEDRITILLKDYRAVRGQFDKIVSIEMLEAVGHKYLGAFFKCCDRLLKPGGLVALQVITYPDQDYDRHRRQVGWITKHIFPGSVVPSLTALCNAMTADSSFIVENLENIGAHYARTLREWRTRFEASSAGLQQPLSQDRFKRKWRYYLSACEAAFAAPTQKDLQLVLTRINSPDKTNE